MSEEAFKSLPAFPVESAASPEERPVGLVEIAGRVKWFDVSKGYGFIVPDSGEGDVLIHVTVLRRDGFQTIYEGARVVAEAQFDRMTEEDLLRGLEGMAPPPEPEEETE